MFLEGALSGDLEVNVTRGKAVTDGSNNQPAIETAVFDELGKAADARVNQIVSANLGHKVALPTLN